MKKAIKDFVGNMVVMAARQPIIRVCIEQAGFMLVPSYLQMLKGADKQYDITWLPIFGDVAKRAVDMDKSCLDYDGLYTIFQALQNMSGVAQLNTAEVGVYKGGTSWFICEALKQMKPGRAAKHYCFDTFTGHAGKDINAYDVHKAGDFGDTSYESVKGLLDGYGAVVLEGRFQDTYQAIENRMFGFAHIDTDLYEPTLFALEFFVARMEPSGIIVVDDYGNVQCDGVKQAVDLFMAKNTQFIKLHLLTGQCVLIKRCPCD